MSLVCLKSLSHFVSDSEWNQHPPSGQPGRIDLTFHSPSNHISYFFPPTWLHCIHTAYLLLPETPHNAPRLSLCHEISFHVWDAFPSWSHMVSFLTSFNYFLKDFLLCKAFLNYFITSALSPNSPCPLALFISLIFTTIRHTRYLFYLSCLVLCLLTRIYNFWRQRLLHLIYFYIYCYILILWYRTWPKPISSFYEWRMNTLGVWG